MNSFSVALEALKQGKRVSRIGWNGKDMWICLSGPLEGRRIDAASIWSEHCSNHARQQPDEKVTVLPCINMKTADGSILMGWLASQTDLLSDDWMILDL